MDGAGWRWVHGLVIPVENILSFKVLDLGLTRVGNVICGNSEEAHI